MRIETKRLVLRPLEEGDLDDLVAMHSTAEVSRYMTVLDRERALARLEQDRRDWSDRGHGLLAILDRASGRFFGRTGLRYWPEFDETEVGWALDPRYWGRGVATEAARACADWGLANLEIPYLTAMIRPDNGRSIAVAVRLGMAPMRSDSLLGQDITVYALTREPRPAPADGSPQR
jgi:RimJ/RimL family protein N-acetyltransferase